MNMDNIKTPLNILTLAFAISFLDGMFALGLSEDVYVIVGLVMIVSLGTILYRVYKK